MSARYVRQSSVDLDDINYEPNRYPTAQDDATGGLADADGHDAAGPLFSGGVGHGQRRTRWQRVVDAVKYPKGLKIVPVVSLLVSLAGTLVTRLGENYTAVQVLMAAAAVRFGFVAAHVAVFEHRPFSSRGDRALLLAVAVFGAAAMLCYYFTVTHLTLADATVLRNLFPVMAGWLSTLVFKEPCPRWEALAAVAGLAGIVLIAQPTVVFGSDDANDGNPSGDGADSDDRGVAVVIGVVGALAAAGSLLCTRSVGYGGTEPAVVVFWNSLLAVAITPVLLVIQSQVDADDFDMELASAVDPLLFLVLGFLTYAAEFLFTQAVQTEPTAAVSMLRYAPCETGTMTALHVRCSCFRATRDSQVPRRGICTVVGSNVFAPGADLAGARGLRRGRGCCCRRCLESLGSEACIAESRSSLHV